MNPSTRRSAAGLLTLAILITGCGRGADKAPEKAQDVKTGAAAGEITVWGIGEEGKALGAFAKARGAWEEPALTGLGDLAVRKKSLGADAMTALHEAASRKDDPRDVAFYALSRADYGADASEAFGKRAAAVARGALARPGEARILAIKMLARSGRDGASIAELVRVVTDAPPGFGATHRCRGHNTTCGRAGQAGWIPHHVTGSGAPPAEMVRR